MQSALADLGTTTTHLPYDGESRTDAIKALAVATLRLDDLVARQELRLPNFIKIDVEGHGHRALTGMRETLAMARPVVVAAFHSPQEIDGTLSILDPLNYEAREIGPASKIVGSPAFRVGGDYVFTPR